MDEGAGGWKKVFGRRPNDNNNTYKSCKDRDEDLLLFREMHKREKDRVVSLLQPVSDEFEVNCSEKLTVVYGGGIMAAAPPPGIGKKGPVFDILAVSGKNDYDWLKTPPATPLFPSLEMETNLPDLIVQREIPIIQPLTRFAGNSQEIGESKIVLPKYSIPKGRPKSVRTDLNLNNSTKTHSLNAKSLDSSSSRERRVNLLAAAANISKSKVSSSSMDTKPKSRTVSPSSVRYSRIPADQIPGLSLEKPTNLTKIHHRSVSASRGRTTTTSTSSNSNFNTGSKKKQDPITRPTRQSCSPSVTRGRKQDNEKSQPGKNNNSSSSSSRTQVLGSRMVDRFLNARNVMSNSEEKKSSNKTNIDDKEEEEEDVRRRTNNKERQNKTKFINTSIINEGSASYYGRRFMSRSSQEMEFKKDSDISSKRGSTISRRCSSVSKRNPIS